MFGDLFLTDEKDVQQGAGSDDDDDAMVGTLFNSKNEIELPDGEYQDAPIEPDQYSRENSDDPSDADVEDNDEIDENYEELDEPSSKLNNPRHLPEVNDRISYWDPDMARIISGTVTPMTTALQRRYPGWRNLKKDGENEESSVNLDIVGNNCVA